MLQVDPLSLATHTAHAASIHFTSSRNSGSVEVGAGDVEIEIRSEVVVMGIGQLA